MRKNRKYFISVFILFLIFISSACSSSKLPVKKLTILRSDGSEVSVKAEIADNYGSRQKGFMFRKKIPDGTGMLFIFEEEQKLDFWMKNTPHPLTIAYIDRGGKIRDILDMTPFSLENVSSTQPVLYALEVPQGWFTRVGVKVGDTLKLDF